MEARDEDLTNRMVRHFQAARRLRDAMKRFPEIKAGFEKLADFHTARVAALASEITKPKAVAAAPVDAPRHAAAR